jgi:MFS family permease
MDKRVSIGTRPATTPFRDPRVLTTLLGVAIAIFMGALENLVISTASPTLVAELHGIEIFSWTSSAYILAATVTTPIWGKVADIFGHRPAMFGLGCRSRCPN